MDSQFTKMECDSSSPELDAELAEDHKLRGNAAYKTGMYEEACENYTKAIFHNPNCATYWSNRSAALMMLQDYTSALDDCTQAIKLDETFTKVYLRAAKCYLMTGNPSLSIDYYRKVLQVEKKNKQALAELQLSQLVQKHLEAANAALESGQFQKAVMFLQKCLEEAPHCISFRSKLAEALVFTKNYNEAQIIANDLLKSDSNNATALYVKAMCYYYQDMPDRATQFFHHALKVDPDHSKSRLALKKAKLLLRKKEEGNSLYREGKHEQAFEVYSEALELDPHNVFTNAKLFCNRALVGSKIGKLEAAIQDCDEAISLDPTYIRAYQRRAKFYQEHGDHDEAVREYNSICQKDPSAENKAALREAKRLQKLAKRKDYYKILGLGKSASADDVKKAYRKNAMLHHPDRHADAEDSVKTKEEQIFKEIAEAYSVLSDSQKRARYDNGQDIEDMMDMDFDPGDLFSNVFGFGFGSRHGASGSHFAFSSGGMHFPF